MHRLAILLTACMLLFMTIMYLVYCMRDPGIASKVTILWANQFYVNERNHNLSLVALQEAIKLDPKSDIAFDLMGEINEDDNDLEVAARDYSAAIDLNPAFGKYWLERGRVYRAQRDYGLALADINKYLELNPKSDRVYDFRAQIEMERGETELALSDYAKAIDLDSTWTLYRFNRAVAYLVEGENDRAIEAITATVGSDADTN